MQLMNCVTVNHSIEVDEIYFSSVSQFLAWDYTEIALNSFHLYRKGHGSFPVSSNMQGVISVIGFHFAEIL